MKLKTLDQCGEKFFKIYQDCDIGFDYSLFDNGDNFGQETLIDASQDDDVESDDGLVNSGVQTCYRDLLVVKDTLRYEPEQVKRSLRTWKLWTPLFKGTLPYKRRK